MKLRLPASVSEAVSAQPVQHDLSSLSQGLVPQNCLLERGLVCPPIPDEVKRLASTTRVWEVETEDSSGLIGRLDGDFIWMKRGFGKEDFFVWNLGPCSVGIRQQRRTFRTLILRAFSRSWTHFPIGGRRTYSGGLS
jgi:hypothetical protein